MQINVFVTESCILLFLKDLIKLAFCHHLMTNKKSNNIRSIVFQKTLKINVQID